MIGLNDPYSGDRSAAESKRSAAVHTFIPDLVERLFAPTGPLVKDLKLEHRLEQAEMALSVAQAFAGNQALLFEAGTGVGKSLAYLIPGLIQAVASKRPFIVSTNTIALQEQIQHKELRICRRLFRDIPALHPYKDFKTAVLVGQNNYLCGTRLAQAIETKTELFPTAEMSELERIVEWSNTTESGLRQELIPSPLPEVWEWVSAEGSACNAKNCTHETCFYRKALARVRQSQLIIINHSLLFSLLGRGRHPRVDVPGVLYPEDFVVLDEAHHVPAVATDHFGEHVSSYGLNRLLSRLYAVPVKGRKKARGLLAKIGSEHDRERVRKVRSEAERFFAGVRTALLSKQLVARCREPDWAEPLLEVPLADLSKSLGDLHHKLEEGPLQDELDGLRSMVAAYGASIRNCLSLAGEDHVYWVERSTGRQEIITLRSAPIDVSAHLRERLFERKTGVVLTSATLAEGNSMESFQAKIGAEGQEVGQVFSPFDFQRNMRVFVASDAPMPTPGKPRLDSDYYCDMIRYCCLQMQGGSLVLFTSYQDMNLMANALQEDFERAGRPFYLQGASGSRQHLAERFRQDGNAILFGTDSFWTGIDVPGPSLSQVIIPRLPFENPQHPIAEARKEACEARGGNPFYEITVPAALVKFRQGVGRLIRNKTDCGTITLLDARLLHKTYGGAFLSVLPQPAFTRFCRMDRDEVFHPLESSR